MSAYSNQVKDYIERYKAETGHDGLLDPHEVAAWAFHNGLHKPNPRTIIDVIAADISQVFREEYRTDKHGRRYRAKHAATHKKGSKTLSLWADLDDPVAPHEHFVRPFAQRRQQIVGDCLQLKTDVDVYNDKRDPVVPVQVPLDFTLDVAEMHQPLKRAA